jgi:hypothetical protein
MPQMPAVHTLVAFGWGGHAVPHVPQFVTSSWRLWQDEPQQVWFGSTHG